MAYQINDNVEKLRRPYNGLRAWRKITTCVTIEVDTQVVNLTLLIWYQNLDPLKHKHK